MVLFGAIKSKKVSRSDFVEIQETLKTLELRQEGERSNIVEANYSEALLKYAKKRKTESLVKREKQQLDKFFSTDKIDTEDVDCRKMLHLEKNLVRKDELVVFYSLSEELKLGEKMIKFVDRLIGRL